MPQATLILQQKLLYHRGGGTQQIVQRRIIYPLINFTFLIILQQKSISFESLSMGEGVESRLTMAIDAAVDNDGWLVIENLHLASESVLSALRHQLVRVGNTGGRFMCFFKVLWYSVLLELERAKLWQINCFTHGKRFQSSLNFIK